MIVILSYVLYSFFALTVIYTAFFSLAGKLKRSKQISDSANKANIAILIPAYKEDAVIVSVAKSLLDLDYPIENYTVFVIADHLKESTMATLREFNIKVVPVNFDVSTKAKSLNYCLDKIDEREYDLVLICDADNVLSKSFLNKVNNAFQKGYKAIQGRRVAKNVDSDYAILDGASEIINNHIFRKGPSALGLSASLIGSGMAFATEEVKKALSTIKAVGGFDKVLQLSMIQRGHQIIYLEDAIVYDEKVSSAQNFKNQRKRWLSSQYIYLARFFGRGIKSLANGKFDYFNIAILHNLFLPRVLTLGLLFVLAVLSIWVHAISPIAYWDYWILLLVYSLSLLLALPARAFDRKLLKAIISLPTAFVQMFLLLFRLKGADTKFIHTEHSKTEVDNSLFSIDEKR
uniref:Glycosyltransferase n=1 Tax=Roseihalotalea indica TaxID=2867963 RepID=A0AA49GIJ1_9BACT|nr:glycosyltransferase [Tunicatimonas sp. TK19036]